MKSLFSVVLFVAALLTVLFSCSKDSQTEASSETSAERSFSKIVFESNVYEFGTIQQGDTVKHTFAFKNDSEFPLIISNASASCGCTVPAWPKGAIKPGESGVITVQFNSTGKSGMQNKSVIITANTLPNTTTLLLKGNVVAPEINSTVKP